MAEELAVHLPMDTKGGDEAIAAPAANDVLPVPGVMVASRGGADPVQGAFDDPRISADPATSGTVMEEAAVLQVVNRTHGDHADAKWIGAAPAALSPTAGSYFVLLEECRQARHAGSPCDGLAAGAEHRSRL